MTTREQFASELLLASSLPVSVNNLKSVVAWGASENTKAENNMLATTLQYEASTDFNEAGVKNYATLQEGIQATKATLFNGSYAGIIDCLARSASPAETCSTIENSIWGSKPNSELVAEVVANYDEYANVEIGGGTTEAPTGEPTPTGETVADPELTIGTSGPEVAALQTFLNNDCSAHLAVDGIFGEFTQLSVKNFQRFFGLEVDGIVGPETWKVIHYVEALHGQQES